VRWKEGEMVTIDPKTLQLLDLVCEHTGQSVQAVVNSVLEEYARKEFFRLSDLGYEQLRADPEAWAEYQAELAEWDATLMDGLDPDEIWQPDGTCVLRDEVEKGTPPCAVKSGSPNSESASEGNNKVVAP
jgi:hypothetical protein